MEKTFEPPPYSDIYPSAPPIEQNAMQQSSPYPNIQQQNNQLPYPTHQPSFPQQPAYPQPQPYPQQVYTQQPINQPQQPLIPQQQTQTVFITQQIIFGENPVAMTCPSCRNHIVTKIHHESNVINHSIALGLCLFGLWCCCCIPYCIDSIKDVSHSCSKCGVFLGRYRRGRV